MTLITTGSQRAVQTQGGAAIMYPRSLLSIVYLLVSLEIV